MRTLCVALLALILWPATACLAAEPTLDQLVEAAVTALKETSYEARMRFIAHYAEGKEQTVHIYHVRPQLYHVRPIKEDGHGRWVEQDEYYIENAVELVRVHLHDGRVTGVEEMPQLSFSVSDALTTKFLRDLTRHEGTSVLDGQSGGISVYMLLQLTSREKPYTITVGLDKRNYFPVFLLVNDATGRERVYYQMESIEYLSANEIEPALFEVPEVSVAQKMPSPRVQQLPPEAVLELEEAEGLGQGRLVINRAPSSLSADATVAAVEYALPLYPTWLPPDFQLEGIRLLDYPVMKGGEHVPALVYQFEVFGPSPADLLSIFQTQAAELDFAGEQYWNEPEAGYLVERQDGWLVAVFGDRPTRELEEIIRNLAANDDAVLGLLNLTRARDVILHQIINEGQ